MADPFLGEIKMVGFNFAPMGWAFCDGSTLMIAQNQALYALLGIQFGGNGTSNFLLPDLRGRVPVNQGSGGGLSRYIMGQAGGSEAATLTETQIPAHSHVLSATSSAGNTRIPTGAALAREAAGQTAVYNNAPTMDSALHHSSISPVGGGQPHTNIQPYLAVNFIIALEGIFPPRS